MMGEKMTWKIRNTNIGKSQTDTIIKQINHYFYQTRQEWKYINLQLCCHNLLKESYIESTYLFPIYLIVIPYVKRIRKSK